MKIDPSAIAQSSSVRMFRSLGRLRSAWAVSAGLAALLAVGCSDGGDASDGGATSDANDARGEGGTDTPPTPAVCSWDRNAPVLAFPDAEVKGTLRGTSRNASTTCTRQKGTGGPEAIYVLQIPRRTVVDLEVISNLDTVVAVRRACEDPLTEVACSDVGIPVELGSSPGSSSGSGSVDAGAAVAPPPSMVPGSPLPPSIDGGQPPSSRDGRLRTLLDTGTYFVLVDEAEPFGVGGAFTLKLRSSNPPPQSSCASAAPVMDGTSLAAESLDLAGEVDPGCGGVTSTPALFYRAMIPSGQRLTVRALPTRGDIGWSPTIQLVSGCNQGLCLASDRAGTAGDRVLRYVNNAATPQPVTLAVGSNMPVTGGVFRLDVSIGEPIANSTCQTARPLTDGQILRNQDLSEGQVSTDFSCKNTGGPSLFYSVRLLPRQSMLLSITSRDSASRPQTPFFVTLRQGCQSNGCNFMPGFNNISWTNSETATTTMVVEISGFPGAGANLFDVQLTLSLPAGGVTVLPTTGLTTTESGGEATFEVALSAPPLAVVTIPLDSSDPKEGTVKPATLTFDESNWDKPQKVTVVGVDDMARDGDVPFTIRVRPSTSADKRYQGIDGEDVQVINRDNEAGVRIDTKGSLFTSESGATATFTVALNRAPTAMVRVPIKSGDESEGKAAPAELVFAPDTWSVPQTVTVTGVDDSAQDGLQSYQIAIGPVSSTDVAYAGITVESLSAINVDDELAAVPAQPVGGSASCFLNGNAGKLAVDQAGLIYVALACRTAGAIPPGGFADGGMSVPRLSLDAAAPMGGTTGNGGGAIPELPPGPFDAGIPTPVPTPFVTVSSDGGKTFAAPVSLGQSGFPELIVGGSGGWAVAIGNDQLRGLAFWRTEDGGRTWTTPMALALNTSTEGLLASTNGQRLAIAAMTQIGTVIWTSADGGRTLTESSATLNTLASLRIDADGTLWVAFREETLRVRKSTDNGNTFDDGIATTIGFPQEVRLGRKTLFAIHEDGSKVQVVDLQSPTVVREVSGLNPMVKFRRVMEVTPNDSLIIVQDQFSGGSEARWLRPAGTMFGAARALGVGDGPPSAAALSDTFLAVAVQRQDRVWVSVEVAP